MGGCDALPVSVPSPVETVDVRDKEAGMAPGLLMSASFSPSASCLLVSPASTVRPFPDWEASSTLN